MRRSLEAGGGGEVLGAAEVGGADGGDAEGGADDDGDKDDDGEDGEKDPDEGCHLQRHRTLSHIAVTIK